ncbi:MFS transporter [Streptomyces sp. NPDC008001]|uniref:MFS transporter n=1 Tax=Streptomyces sp. NPDC008001 TaxID=3364804 RepID=UPI0036E1E896
MGAIRSVEGGPLRRTARGAGRVLRAPFAAAARGVRKATHAHGAGESGLGKLIELHAVNSAGDMLITVALASTVFFSVPTDQARGRVALYLAVTMAPFTLLAPVIGPLLDRLPHGRRAAMAGAMLTRALLALTMSGAVASGGLELYPAALGVLVASKAYGVVRSAVVPRLLPPRISLVKANSRVTLGGLLATGLAAPLGAALHKVGPEYPLYGAFVVFVLGTVLSFSLPHKVDSAKGEARARLVSGEHPSHRRRSPALAGPSDVKNKNGGNGRSSRYGRYSRNRGNGRNGRNGKNGWNGKNGRNGKNKASRPPGLRTVGSSVLHALQANSAMRMLSGFLTFFLAFLLRVHPLGGLSPAFSLGVVAVAAGAGNALGTAIGALLRSRGPEKTIALVLMASLGTAVATAVFYGPFFVVLVAAVAGIAQALGKQSLDSLIQRDVPEEVRTSAFARSETLLQMSWVAGGAIGILLPLNGTLGMAVASAVLALGVATAVRGLLAAARRGSPHPRVA